MKHFKVIFKESSSHEVKGEFNFFATSKEMIENSVLRLANLLWYGNESRLPKPTKREINLAIIADINSNKSIGTTHCKSVLFSPYFFEIENI